MATLLTSQVAAFVALLFAVSSCLSIFLGALEISHHVDVRFVPVPASSAADAVVDVEKGGTVKLIFIQQFSDCQSNANQDVTEGFDESRCNATISILNDTCSNNINKGNGIKFVCTAFFSSVANDNSGNSGNSRMSSLMSSIANIVHTSIMTP